MHLRQESSTTRGAIWQQIWDRKHSDQQLAVHQSGGFDLLDAGQYAALTRPFIGWMGPLQDFRVLEVGCGTGAFALQLGPCKEICGIDFSETAIARVRRELKGDFKVAPAAAIPFEDGRFDRTYSFGVFFYFDSLDYARAALEEQLRVLKPGGQLFVFEVNDEDKQDLYWSTRGQEPRSGHKKSSADADHLFFKKSFFTEFAKSHNLQCEIRDESEMGIDFHSGACYRFAVRIGA